MFDLTRGLLMPSPPLATTTFLVNHEHTWQEYIHHGVFLNGGPREDTRQETEGGGRGVPDVFGEVKVAKVRIVVEAETIR